MRVTESWGLAFPALPGGESVGSVAAGVAGPFPTSFNRCPEDWEAAKFRFQRRWVSFASPSPLAVTDPWQPALFPSTESLWGRSRHLVQRFRLNFSPCSLCPFYLMMPVSPQRPTATVHGDKEAIHSRKRSKGIKHVAENPGQMLQVWAPGRAPLTCAILHFRCPRTGFQCQNL